MHLQSQAAERVGWFGWAWHDTVKPTPLKHGIVPLSQTDLRELCKFGDRIFGNFVLLLASNNPMLCMHNQFPNRPDQTIISNYVIHPAERRRPPGFPTLRISPEINGLGS